jgi:hypothetical protein
MLAQISSRHVKIARAFLTATLEKRIALGDIKATT